mmetsp:Transcript_27871/g.65434  ORF Transcript_27871/g.65434 Transcript_27871/m.65434 type:complete len:137 (+) Transcript_27871:92-502(+)
MLMFKPFALLAACVLGLAAMVTPVAAQCCDCSPVGRRRLLDSFLFPEGRHDEEAQEHLAQRRKLEVCYCLSTGKNTDRESCCDECSSSGESRRRLEPKSAKTKSPKSPKCKSSKSNGEPERRLSKLRASAKESSVI